MEKGEERKKEKGFEYPNSSITNKLTFAVKKTKKHKTVRFVKL